MKSVKKGTKKKDGKKKIQNSKEKRTDFSPNKEFLPVTKISKL